MSARCDAEITMTDMAAVVLTDESLSWLRIADEVTFRWRSGDDHVIRAELKRSISARQHHFWREMSVAGDVHHLDRGLTPQDHRCFTSLSGAKASWRTTVNALRAGDKMSLRWIASNNTKNLRDVGYHADELYLRAARLERGTRKVYEWLLHYQVGPDNSARMIRDAGQSKQVEQDADVTFTTDAWVATIAGLVPGGRRRYAHAAVSPEVAASLGDELHIGTVSVGILCDADRDPDEVVVIDREWRKELGVAWMAPPEVIAAGAGAVAFHAELRAGGTSWADAPFLAIAAAGDSHST